MSSVTTSIEPSRRTLAKGAAWSVPALVVGAAAPAVAASQCSPTTSTWAAGGTLSGVGVTWTTNGSTKTDRLDSQNKKLMTVLGTSGWIAMDQYGDNRLGQTLTFTFPRAVYCLKFTLSDLDANTTSPLLHVDDYVDSVTLNAGGSATFTASPRSPSDIAVSGGATSSVTVKSSHSPATSGGYDYTTSTRGTVDIASSGPVSSFTLTYTNAGYQAGTLFNDQQIYISRFTYSTTPCPC